ncbi:hypothetical protein VTJ49DRAFT_5098 [Mycothermus thermophilus]|uniref:Ribonucleases P/MRP subunit Pop8-like domain-containing protein n=1 Tax=Humicola insolens TaxID=85995 RepID=A0ABR3VLM6_HUMIN
MTSNPPDKPSPDAMDIDQQPTTTEPTNKPHKRNRPAPRRPPTTTLTLRSPPFAYAHLQLVTPPTSTEAPNPAVSEQPALLDNLQLRSYLTAALRQFLGDTGAAIPLDILLLRGASAWVRVPREDLAAFAAAVTAFEGLASGNDPSSDPAGLMLLRVMACGDWLGALVGRDEEGVLWTG